MHPIFIAWVRDQWTRRKNGTEILSAIYLYLKRNFKLCTVIYDCTVLPYSSYSTNCGENALKFKSCQCVMNRVSVPCIMSVCQTVCRKSCQCVTNHCLCVTNHVSVSHTMSVCHTSCQCHDSCQCVTYLSSVSHDASLPAHVLECIKISVYRGQERDIRFQLRK